MSSVATPSTPTGDALNGLNGLHRERIAILDAGAQYGKVIDRRVRELNVESEILPLATVTAQKLQDDGYK